MKIKLVLYLLLSLFSIGSFAQNFDIDLLTKINVDRNKSLDPAFTLITDSAIPISIATPVVIYTIGIIEKDISLKKKGLYIGEAFLMSAIISSTMKYTIGRPRPALTYPFIEQVTKANSPSFPSGHTSAAFSTATSLTIAFPKWYVVVPSYLWAGAVGYSRMHLGVHYPSDVLVGAIIGAGSAYLTYKINHWLNSKRNR